MSFHKLSSVDSPTNSGDGKPPIKEPNDASAARETTTRTNTIRGRLHAMPSILRIMSAEERAALNLRLKRKIDIRLLPMMLIMYILNYLDRNNIASARLAGLEQDLDLKGSQFQSSVSILFVGYLLMQGLWVTGFIAG
jgi:hypothetical protein